VGLPADAVDALECWRGYLRADRSETTGGRSCLTGFPRGKMRSKIPDLAMALEGRFGDHHALMCRLHLDHIGHLDAMIAALDAQIEAMMLPFRAQRDLLTTIPGIGPLAAAAVLSEIGAEVTGYFPDAAHLASWAGLCPGNHESAGKRHSGRRRHGNLHLQAVLVGRRAAPRQSPALSRSKIGFGR
jgi:transposase